jgi:hypothetical protein
MKFIYSGRKSRSRVQLAPRVVAGSLLGLLLPLSLMPGAIAADVSDAVGLRFEQSAAVNQTRLTQTWVNHEITYQETGVEYKRKSCPKSRDDDDDDDAYRYGVPASVYGPTVLQSSVDVTPYRQGRPKVTAYFLSSKTPPAPGLRVVIQNQTVGSATLPYTDREYDQGNRSQSFVVSPGDTHKSKYLSLLAGDNRMTYQIKRGDRVIDSGEFMVKLDIDDRHTTATKTLSRQVIEIPCPTMKQYKKH